MGRTTWKNTLMVICLGDFETALGSSKSSVETYEIHAGSNRNLPLNPWMIIICSHFPTQNVDIHAPGSSISELVPRCTAAGHRRYIPKNSFQLGVSASMGSTAVLRQVPWELQSPGHCWHDMAIRTPGPSSGPSGPK